MSLLAFLASSASRLVGSLSGIFRARAAPTPQRASASAVTAACIPHYAKVLPSDATIGMSLVYHAVTANSKACIEALGQALRDQTFASYSVLLHLEQALLELWPNPRHRKVLLQLLKDLPFMNLSEVVVCSGLAPADDREMVIRWVHSASTCSVSCPLPGLAW